MLLACIVFLIGSGIQLVGTLPSFYAGRFLTGLGVGPLTVACPLYISEIAPAPLRGRCIGLFEIMYQFGGLLGFWINYGCSLHVSPDSATQWHVPVAIQLPLVGLLLVGWPFLHETPRWLIKKDRVEAATKSLCRVRNLDAQNEYLRRELGDIVAELQLERQMSNFDSNATAWSRFRSRVLECISPSMRRRISVGIITQLIGQLSGINGINYYSPTIFQSLGLRGTQSSLFATGIYGVVKTVTAFVAYFIIVDRFGRRTLLLAGSLIMIVALFFVGGYIQVARPNAAADDITSGGIAACAFIYIYVIGFVSSYAGVPWILSNECVPMNIRTISATLGAATQWLFNLVITKATPYMITSIGGGTFFFYGACVVLGVVYVWFFVPETKNVSLEHMAKSFNQIDLIESERVQNNLKLQSKRERDGEDGDDASDVKQLESV